MTEAMYRAYMTLIVIVVLAGLATVASFTISAMRERNDCPRRGGKVLQEKTRRMIYVNKNTVQIPVYNSYCSVDRFGNPVRK